MTSVKGNTPVSGIGPDTIMLPHDDGPPRSRWRYVGESSVVPLICLTILGVFCILYRAAPDTYTRLLTALMLMPFHSPFMDWEFVPSAIACWNRGVDVYVDNTCYDLLPHLVFAYSPLWLRATFIPFDKTWVNPVGLFLAASFFLSLATLPWSGRGDRGVLLLAAPSSLVVFAVERGNVDLIMFLMAVLGLHLWTGSFRVRLAAYLVFALAGFLKFYPFVLLALALRERKGAFLAIAGVFLTTLALFAWHFHDELLEAKKAVPTGPYFTVLFGAVNLPYGVASLAQRAVAALGVEAGSIDAIIGTGLPVTFFLILLADAAARAVRLSERGGVRRELAAMPAKQVGFLVGGSALVCGCFLSGQSIGYRGVFLLLVIPGVIRLSRSSPLPAVRRFFGRTLIAILFVLWVLTIRFCLVALDLSPTIAGDRSAWGLIHWLLHEAAWWWIVGALLSTITGFVLNSASFRASLEIYRRCRLGGLSARGL